MPQFYQHADEFHLGGTLGSTEPVTVMSVRDPYNEDYFRALPYWKLVGFDQWCRSGTGRRSPINAWPNLWRYMQEKLTGNLPTPREAKE
jgi:hypothetical protein